MPNFVERQGQQPQQGKFEGDAPLLRVTGLWESKSGKALMGGIDVTKARYGGTEPLGEELIALIRNCIEAGRPLRFLIFQNQNGKGAPYNLSATMGRARPEGEGGEGQQAWRRPQVEEPSPTEEPLPTPRPGRRSAPTRR